MSIPTEIQERIDMMVRVQELGDRVFALQPQLATVLFTLSEAIAVEFEDDLCNHLEEKNPKDEEVGPPPDTPIQNWIEELAAYAHDYKQMRVRDALCEISIALEKETIHAQAAMCKSFIPHMRASVITKPYIDIYTA